MTRQPEFIDNLEDNTLARALNAALGGGGAETAAEGGLAEAAEPPDEVRIATGYFSPTGFAKVAGQLTAVPAVRLMLGVDLAAWTPDQQRSIDEQEAAFEQRRMQTGMRRMDETLRHDRDHLPFTRASGAALRALVNALRAGNMEVRRYEKAFLHAKAYIFTPADGALGKPEGIIAGSSNLTGAGLTKNLELNLGRYDRPIVEQGRLWFDSLWDEAEPYDLAVVFEDVFRPHSPWDIFIRVLWRLYGAEVEEDRKDDQDLPLTSFQKHGVARVLRLIRETGGAIVADEVGLGKTFIAGEVLEIYRARRQRALLICPAALRDSTWKKFLARFHLSGTECLSFEELAHDQQLRDFQRPNADQEKLLRPLDEYQLIVVDEAHNYRNPDAPTRAAALRRLLYGKRRDVLLLTATPVNNSLWDLYHLIRFFVRQDAKFAGLGITSIRERFDLAMKEDPSSLHPDVLYPIIDATTVKRTRQFVKKHYSGDYITGPEGNPVPIVFPKPHALSVRYNLDDLMPGFFDRLEAALDPDGPDGISLARYTPDKYLLEPAEDEENARAAAAIGLLRSGILKRFESSVFAFRNTVTKMAGEHDRFLEALDAGYVVSTAFMKEISADDETAFEDMLNSTEHREDAALYDVETLRAEVERDRDILRALAAEAGEVTRERDPKLRALADELISIARKAQDEAISGEDETQKRKVLVFSYFADTVKWIKEFLDAELGAQAELAGYRGRMTWVSGGVEEAPRRDAVQGFAPVSMESTAGEDLYDLLICTDVLAEGVNLQQCRNIINFDMPWNPMRLVQRHGRIDRIGSPHSHVFMRTIFPADRLDQMLNLETRILNKLAMAAASVGVAAPIEGAAGGQQVFSETRDEIEKLLAEDASLYERGGTAGAAQTGEEYRQTLRQALDRDRRRIETLPWKIGSGMMKGARRGVFFCAVVGERTYLRFVPADGDWEVAAEAPMVREIGTCLRLIECTPDTDAWRPDFLQERVYDFWEAAQQNILTDWMRETDPANLQPKVRPLNLRAAEFIRSHPPAGMAEEKINRALDILESPWPRREEVMLREWFEDPAHEGAAKSEALIEQILDVGLEPVEPPEPLPPIQAGDIELLCWMGIEAEG